MKNYILFSILLFAVGVLPSCSPNEDVTFPDNPCLIPDINNTFKLCKPMKVIVDNHKYIIPKDFQTDLASIPRVLWSIYSPLDSKTIIPAILHDYLYQCPKTSSKYQFPEKLTRKKIDSIFYSSLIDNMVNPIVAYQYWMAVRLGGSSYFNQGNDCAIKSKEDNKKISN